MDVVRKYVIEKLHFSVDGYNYNVKMLTSVDGGKFFITAAMVNSSGRKRKP